MADEPKQQPLKIIPGKVIVPTDNMRRPWGELVSIDLKTRTGTFRNESTDQVMPFTVVPYAELLHHATLGDLQDFRVGERAIFRLHPNEAGEWVWLTYIQDEMNFLNNHKEYYWVDELDGSRGQITCTDANADKSFVREKGIKIETDAQTRFWKEGQPASFGDIRVGDKLRTKTHGIGKGKVRVAWEVFLDDASLQKFQAEQVEVHKQRIAAEGMPAYVDARDAKTLQLTMFPQGRDLVGRLKAGVKVRVAPAGVDRKPTTDPAEAVVAESKPSGRLQAVTLQLDRDTDAGFKPTGLARVWLRE
jgi:hypothetical protein